MIGICVRRREHVSCAYQFAHQIVITPRECKIHGVPEIGYLAKNFVYVWTAASCLPVCVIATCLLFTLCCV